MVITPILAGGGHPAISPARKNGCTSRKMHLQTTQGILRSCGLAGGSTRPRFVDVGGGNPPPLANKCNYSAVAFFKCKNACSYELQLALIITNALINWGGPPFSLL